MWVWKCLTPHPPIIVPEVGKGRESVSQKTVDAMNTLSLKLSNHEPDMLFLLTPHHHYQRGLHVVIGEQYNGNLAMFGAPEVEISLEGSPEAGERLERHLTKYLPIHIERQEKVTLDHASIVPLTFLLKKWKKRPKLVIANPIGLTPDEAFQAGVALNALEDENTWGLLASGDLSHRLTADAPAGFHPNGREFDALVIKALYTNRPEHLLELPERFIENAGECGMRSVLIFMGVNSEVPLDVLSYEGPFGVGYCVSYSVFEKISSSSEPEQFEELVPRIARDAIERYLKTGQILRLKEANLSNNDALLKMKACFVSIKQTDTGELRGCIGTISPVKSSLGEEIISNAIAAAVKDPRFPPLSGDELSHVTISVDILSPPQQINGADELNPSEFGVIIEKDLKRGVLLPDLDGITTVEQQLAIASRKAGICSLRGATIYKFTVSRYTETH